MEFPTAKNKDISVFKRTARSHGICRWKIIILTYKYLSKSADKFPSVIWTGKSLEFQSEKNKLHAPYLTRETSKHPYSIFVKHVRVSVENISFIYTIENNYWLEQFVLRFYILLNLFWWITLFKITIIYYFVYYQIFKWCIFGYYLYYFSIGINS